MKSTVILALLIICGCGSIAPDNLSDKDRIFSLDKPGKEALKNASSDFISNIVSNREKMSGCAEQFLLTDDYQDRIYRRNIRPRKIADGLFYLYKNELALSLAKSDDDYYRQLLLKYYYPGGTDGMTGTDMISSAIRRLTYRGKDFYGRSKEIPEDGEISFKENTDLADGRILSVYTIRWSGFKDNSIYNTIFIKAAMGGKEILLPVQHNVVGLE